jgi:hypothetical protein
LGRDRGALPRCSRSARAGALFSGSHPGSRARPARRQAGQLGSLYQRGAERGPRRGPACPTHQPRPGGLDGSGGAGAKGLCCAPPPLPFAPPRPPIPSPAPLRGARSATLRLGTALPVRAPRLVAGPSPAGKGGLRSRSAPGPRPPRKGPGGAPHGARHGQGGSAPASLPGWQQGGHSLALARTAAREGVILPMPCCPSRSPESRGVTRFRSLEQRHPIGSTCGLPATRPAAPMAGAEGGPRHRPAHTTSEPRPRRGPDSLRSRAWVCDGLGPTSLRSTRAFPSGSMTPSGPVPELRVLGEADTTTSRSTRSRVGGSTSVPFQSEDTPNGLPLLPAVVALFLRGVLVLGASASCFRVCLPAGGGARGDIEPLRRARGDSPAGARGGG